MHLCDQARCCFSQEHGVLCGYWLFDKPTESFKRQSWQSNAAKFANKARLRPGYNGGHARAPVGENRLDRLGGGMGTVLLEAVWRADFPALLRSRKLLHHDRALDGERADLFMAGNRVADFSDAIHDRSG